MIVSELIEILSKYPQGLRVAYELHSEYCLIEEKDIHMEELSKPRDDGWVENIRPDKETETYLVLPGN